MKQWQWVAATIILASAAARAEAPHVRAELLAEPAAVRAGEPFWVAVKLTHAPGWHTYYKEPGDSGLPTKIEWKLPEGFSAGEIQWPTPERIEIAPLVDFGYHGEAALLIEITPPKEIRGGSVTLAARVKWLECEEVCIPGQADVSLTLPVSASPTAPTEAMAAFFKEARGRLEKSSGPSQEAEAPPTLPIAAALLFAFFGGVLLNLMPCVLPVISIKLIGFLEAPREDLRRHGLLYGAGVMASFWLLAGVLMILRAGGEKLGWGFQLQSPVFVVFMALLFFILALNLLGLFEIGTSLIGLAGAGGGKSSAFVTGGLAVLVATPCTAPFMGPALGVALTQPAFLSLAVFTALGAGMASPYVAISFFPAALRRLPRPGPWMLTMKEGMAFLFFATTVWLLWVLGLQTGPGTVAVVLLGALGIALAAWLGGPLAQRAKGDGRRKSFRLAGILLGLLMAGLALFAARGTGSDAIPWEPYSEKRVEEYVAQGRPVFVDFTAAWCLTCQVNERTALTTNKVRDAFRARNVAALKADWTNRDPAITAALESYGRSGVPLYVYYPPGREPVLLPALLTADIVVETVERSEP